MKTLPLVLLAVAASAATSAAVTVTLLARAPAGAPAAVAAADPDELARLARAVSAADARGEELARTLAELRAELSAAPRGDARLPLGEIEDAVARALERRAREPGATDAPAPAGTPKSVARKATAQSAFDRLVSGALTAAESRALWKEIVANGDAERVIALLEARAAARPDDVDAQRDLGHAYLQKIFTVGDGPEKGIWASKADKAFDKALALDDHDWDARFSKAISLSFWPPVFGKTGEAIKNFEVLVAQQAGMPTQPQFAQTHLLLGNLYLQQGDKAKALAAWQNGLSWFPGDAQMQQQIADAQE